jgi:glutaredoxin-related protein
MMNVKVIGSHLCPDTLYALNKLRELNAGIDFVDISASLANLKVYLGYREKDPLYEPVKKAGSLGIPLLVFEDGTRTLDLDEALRKLKS